MWALQAIFTPWIVRKGYLALVICAVCLQGCGYKPLSTYSHAVFGKNIYVDVMVSYRDPENSVLIKDHLLNAVVEQLNSNVASSEEEADSFIKVHIKSVRFASLAENRQGFTSFYKTYVTLLFEYQDIHGQKGEMMTVGRYIFSMNTSSILTDSRRLDAINQASKQALDTFISEVAALKVYPTTKG